MSQKKNSFEEIGRLTLRHYYIRKRVEELRRSFKHCTEAQTGLGNSMGELFQDPTRHCYIEYIEGNIDIEEMCENCREWETKIRPQANKLSIQGAVLRRRAIKLMKEEGMFNDEELFCSGDMLLERIFG